MPPEQAFWWHNVLSGKREHMRGCGLKDQSTEEEATAHLAGLFSPCRMQHELVGTSASLKEGNLVKTGL